jgi:hypothetical protein
VQQYPEEQSHAPEFTCDETLRNSQYSTQMQALGAAVSDDAKEIFTLLQSQKFFLIVTLLNTITNTNITVTQTVGTITTKLQIDVSVPMDGCLLISCNLTANIATVNINISSSQAIGGVRIGLSAPSIVAPNNEAKELFFAQSFTISNHTMSQQPYFNVELIQVINETRPLSVNDVSNYSGLWIPVFIQDDDQNFYTQTDFDNYHTNFYTILTIDITEAAYYIYNLEKPIVKTTKAIFKNILFATMCLEMFGFAFLIFKLAIIPLVQLIVSRISPKVEESKEKKDGENDDDDDESEKEEDKEKHDSDDDDDDDDETAKKFEPGKNEWYIPNSKI